MSTVRPDSGQVFSQLGRSAIGLLAAWHGVTAHDPDDLASVQVCCRILERISDGVIMKSRA